MEFPLWLSQLRTCHGILENAGLIPGLTQWVKDLAWLWLWLQLWLWLAAAAPI